MAPGDAGIDLVRGNVLAMPFTAAFDVAVCFGAFGHFLPQEQAQFIAQVAQVLKPGGRFMCVTTLRPPVWSARYWRVQGFNALMSLRNRLHTPPFIMYYLTSLLPEVVALLRQHGFTVTVHADVFPERFQHVRLVIGTLTERAMGPQAASPCPVSDTHDQHSASQAKPL